MLEPREYWARRAILGSVACRGAQVAAIGSQSGGAHGNPRTSSWFQRPDGTLVDVPAAFEPYGGPSAVSVNRIAAGPDDWLIAGNRLSGAAVWISEDAAVFRLRDDDPALSSDGERVTDQGWREVRTPTQPAVTGDAQMTVAADGGQVLLVADDGLSGRAWVATWGRD